MEVRETPYRPIAQRFVESEQRILTASEQLGQEVSNYTAQKVKDGQTSLVKRINNAWITGVVTGLSVGILIAYISWESTGRKGKLLEYISSSLLFSSLITISSLAGASVGFTQALKRKFESHKDS